MAEGALKLAKDEMLVATERSVPGHFLHPGEVFATRSSTLVTTVLGSCVAVCLYDVVSGVGGMNHFVLPHTPLNQSASRRHAEVAIADLVHAVQRLGANRRTLRAKLFGGCTLLYRLGASQMSPKVLQVGQNNVNEARALLGCHGIPIVRERVLQDSGMMVKMLTSTGDVWCRRVAAPQRVVIGPRKGGSYA